MAPPSLGLGHGAVARIGSFPVNHFGEIHMPTANVAILVPVSGFGPAVDVSALVGEKTVILSGRYQGAYVLYGSHDGSNFAPLLIFNAGGIESIKQTFSGALSQVKLKSLASNASGVSASISGLSVPLDNSFTSIGPVGKGLSGAVDLGNNAYQTDLNFMGFGRLNGVVVVEGSSDGMGFNPIGEFSAAPSGTSLLGGGGIEFSPLGTKDKVRYVRLNVLGDVPGSFLVTIGGAQSDSGGGGGETLADAYLAGATSVDQTLSLLDANGGRVVFDASDPGFTDDMMVQLVGYGGADAFEFFKDGSLAMGVGVGIVIGEPGFQAGAPASGCVAIGRSASVYGPDPRSIAVGMGALTTADHSVAVGVSAQADAFSTVSIGPSANCTAYADNSVVVGKDVLSNGHSNVVVGDSASSAVILVSDVVVVGHGASASAATIYTGGRLVALGAYSSSVDGGVSVGYSAQSGSVDAVLVGRNTSGVGVSDVVVGAGAQSTDSLATGGAVLVGGGAQGDSGSVVLGLGAQGVDDSVVAGLSALAASSGSVVLGRGAATTPGSDYSIVVGVGATSKGLQSVVVGYGAESGVGSVNVVVGSLSTVGGVGAANTLVGYGCYVGDPVGETRDFHNNVRVGGGNVVYANYSVVLGNNCVVGDTDDASIIGDCVAVGTWSAVTGSYGMAFGLNASAGEHEVVFGDGVSNEGYVKKFHIVGDVAVNASGTFSAAADSVYNPGVNTTLTAVGSLPAGLLDRQAVTISGSVHYDGVWYVHHVDRAANKFDISTAFAGNDSGSWANVEYADLFSFDKTRLTGADTTVMTLLIEKHSGGVIAAVPVTLSAPVSGHSYLQVANS